MKSELTLKFSISRSSLTSRVKTVSERVATVTFILKARHSMSEGTTQCQDQSGKCILNMKNNGKVLLKNPQRWNEKLLFPAGTIPNQGSTGIYRNRTSPVVTKI